MLICVYSIELLSCLADLPAGVANANRQPMHTIAMVAATVDVMKLERRSFGLPASLFDEDLGHKIPLRAGVEKSLRRLPMVLRQQLHLPNQPLALTHSGTLR